MTSLERKLIHELRNIIFNLYMGKQEEIAAVNMGVSDREAAKHWVEARKSLAEIKAALGVRHELT